jgi:hypothetical protein
MAVSFATRNLISRSRVSRCLGLRSTILSSRQMSTEAMPLPNADPSAKKNYPEKISTIVEQIAKLNLLEVADLNELLKVSSKFNFLSGTQTKKFSNFEPGFSNQIGTYKSKILKKTPQTWFL